MGHSSAGQERDAASGQETEAAPPTGQERDAAPGQETEAAPPAGQPHPPRYRSDSIELAAHPAAVAPARLHARRALRSWGLEDLTADAGQIVSELLANAVQAHQREALDAPVRLILVAGLRTLLIAVRDASGKPPVPGLRDGDDEGGRGLVIVDALSAYWDTRPAPGGGKIVRCLVRGQRRTRLPRRPGPGI